MVGETFIGFCNWKTLADNFYLFFLERLEQKKKKKEANALATTELEQAEQRTLLEGTENAGTERTD